MASQSSLKKRKAPPSTPSVDNAKRVRQTPHAEKQATSTHRAEPESATSERSFLTARGSPESEDIPFVTPRVVNPIRKDKEREESLGATVNETTSDVNLNGTSLRNGADDNNPSKPHRRRTRRRVKKTKTDSQDAELDQQVSSHPTNALSAKEDAQENKPTTEQEKTVGPKVLREIDQESWSLSPVSGGCFLDQDPIFVQDDADREYIVIAANRAIHLLSLHTSLIEMSLPAPNNLFVQAIAPSAVRSDLIYVLYDNGSVYRWNLGDEHILYQSRSKGTVINTFAMGKTSDSTRESVFTIVARPNQNQILLDKMCIHSTHHDIQGLRIVGEADYIVAYGTSVVILGRRRPSQSENICEEDFTWVELPTGVNITDIDVSVTYSGESPKQGLLSLVLGTSEGQLHVHENLSSLFSKKSKQGLQPPRILHWHREAVAAVKFSKDHNYIISGGSETVLVLWQLTTGHKQFLPHLTSAVERLVVSPAGNRYAVMMGDNSVMVLSTSELKPVAHFAGLQSAASAFVQAPIPAVLHPKDRNKLFLVVPPTRPSPQSSQATHSRPFLQTFDIRLSRHITRQALSRNNTTDFNTGPEQNLISPPDVSQLQISNDGCWLATFDDWVPPLSDIRSLVPQNGASLFQEQSKRHETHIKIWKYDKDDGLWTLTSRLDAPHTTREGSVSNKPQIQLVSDPSGVGFASVGEDDCVRVWRPRTRMRSGVPMKAEDGTKLIEWTCKQTIELPLAAKRADSPLTTTETDTVTSNSCLAWSEDGSMLVAAQSSNSVDEAPVLHFIDLATGSVSTKASAAPEGLVSMEFVDRYLITLGSGYVNLWDVVEDKLSHRIRISTSHETTPILAVNRINGSFAVSSETHLHVFKTSMAKAISEIKLNTNTAALLSYEKGYLLLYTDGSLQFALPNGSSGFELDMSEQDLAEDVQMGLVTIEDSSESVLSASGQLLSGQLNNSVDLDDRPIVRPEQLAEVFETTQSFAMLSVQDMFHAVVDLYGRKPEPRSAEIEA